MKKLFLIAMLCGCLGIVSTPFTHADEAQSGSPVDQVFPKIVKLYGAGGLQNLANYGTGFFVSDEGHILTVWNHLLDTEDVIAVLDNGRRLPARFIAGAGEAGVALLKVEVRNAPHFKLAEAARCTPGTPVYGFSNMFNVAAGDEPVSAIHGIVATITPLTARRGRYEIPYRGDVYIVDAIMNNPGAAGGALTTHDGRLLGIIGKEVRDQRSNLWINYAIPVLEIQETIEQLVRGEVVIDPPKEMEAPVRPIDTSPLGFALVPDIVARTPAFVESVSADSTAAKAGMQPDDLIVLVNQELIQSCQEFYARLETMKKGDSLELTLRRDRQLIHLTLLVPDLE